MSSDNLTGADNQQERPSFAAWLDALPVDLGHWVAGFVDGEGSFNVPIRRLRSVSQDHFAHPGRPACDVSRI
jgi:hypothetical protein